MSASASQVNATHESLAEEEEQFRLEIPPDPSYLSVARLFAASVARHFACREEIVEDLKVAISETVTNAIKAHRDAGTSDPVLLAVDARAGELAFSIVDAGRGFEFTPPPAPVDAHPTELRRGNLGLALVRSLFPSADVRRNADVGMSVTFSLDIAASREEEA